LLINSLSGPLNVMMALFIAYSRFSQCFSISVFLFEHLV
jgi:hypothetical protein